MWEFLCGTHPCPYYSYKINLTKLKLWTKIIYKYRLFPRLIHVMDSLPKKPNFPAVFPCVSAAHNIHRNLWSSIRIGKFIFEMRKCIKKDDLVCCYFFCFQLICDACTSARIWCVYHWYQAQWKHKRKKNYKQMKFDRSCRKKRMYYTNTCKHTSQW